MAFGMELPQPVDSICILSALKATLVLEMQIGEMLVNEVD